jgi:hypothetical protein
VLWRQVVALAIVCASTAAEADVTLDQPSGVCPLDPVRNELAALMPQIAAPASVTIETRHAGARIAATVTLDGGDARELRARDCAEAAKSIALVIAMTLRERAIEPAQAPLVVEPPAPPPLPPAPPVPDEPGVRVAIAAFRTEHVPIELLALAGGLTDHHARPAAVVGGRIGRGHLSLGLELELARSETIDVGDDGALRVRRTLASLTPCATLARVSLCGLATGGYVRGAAMRLANARTVSRGTFELGVRAEWIYPVLARVGLRVHADALQAIGSAGFMVDQSPVWSTDPRELRLGVGVVAIFL